ncbi:MAG: BNR-4 repeat-containing protein, partial [Planctomycetota bacterium]
LFSPSHGDWTTRSFIHRSSRPHAFDRWETVSDGPLFAYPQPHYDPKRGFALLHTVYADGRGLHVKHSRDGRDWTPSRRLAAAGRGHYQVSHHDTGHGVLWTAFDYHPHEGGLDRRTNLYVMRSDDWGVTWRTADGRPVELPIDSPRCSALVHDFEGEARLCFIKDLITDAEGRPLVLYSTSRGWEPGPQHGPHAWWLARQRPGGWTHHRITDSDHNYDAGSLFVDLRPGGGERLTLIGATEPGPQPFAAGGRIAVWTSDDAGVTWTRDWLLTPADAEVNHNYPRRPLHAHPGFRVFWADGHGYHPSSSSLWFAADDDPTARRVVVRLAARSDPRTPERPRQPQLPAD